MIIGVDLGGTNLRAAVFDPTAPPFGGAAGRGQAPTVEGYSPTPLRSHKELVGEPREPDRVIERVAAVCEQLGPGRDEVAVGVGIAAMLRDAQGTVARSPHLRWRDVAFGSRLAARLGPRFRLRVCNDVDAIVWGEHIAGAARGCRDVLGVYVGTGIGAGVISGGRLVTGASYCAGEIGHVKVRWDDAAAPCACGQRGCVEAYVGGSYVAARIARELAAGASPAIVAAAGGLERVTPSHVDAAAAAGDDWALGLWTELGPLLAIALGNALAVLNSERLVLGGGLLGRCPMLYELVVATLPIATPAASFEPLTIALAELGDDAGLVGSAHLAQEQPVT